MIKVRDDYYVGNCPKCGVEQMGYKEEKVDVLCSDCIEKEEKTLKYKCAHCGKELHLENEDECNWYGIKEVNIKEDGKLEIYAKVQHLSDTCNLVSYLIFEGKLIKVEKKEELPDKCIFSKEE